MSSPTVSSDFSVSHSALPSDYWQLLKPRVMSLVVFTALVGFVVSSGHLHPFLMLVSLCAIAVGAGASGALNMWYDADIDAVMLRTKNRPIPSGKILPENARDFGLFLSLLSIITLGLASNFLAAGLLAFTIFFYVVVYSMWLKRSTPQNIVIGGLAGAFPPLIASAAVTGMITLEGVILCAIIFMWTPAHFWALALVKKADYAKVNIPMMPNIKGDKHTTTEIIIYAVLLYLTALLPVYFGFGDVIYLAVASGLGLYYLLSCVRIKLNLEKPLFHKVAMKSFALSILYLFALFASLLLEHFLGVHFL